MFAPSYLFTRDLFKG